jgi:hypothetical protein
MLALNQTLGGGKGFAVTESQNCEISHEEGGI